MNRILIVAIALTFLFSAGCTNLGGGTPVATAVPSAAPTTGIAIEHVYTNEPTIQDEPDRTGSRAHINQEIKRSANWTQFVQNSEFKLGKMTKDEYDDFYTSLGTYPMIDGSTVCVPMAVEFSWQHLKLDNEDGNNFVYFQTTNVAYECLIKKGIKWGGYIDYGDSSSSVKDKPVDIIFATEPSDDELALAAKNKVELTIKPVCYDAFVFITHKDNPVNSLTVEQIQKIYSGEITNWKDVGGSDEKISAYQREENSGSQTTMEKQVMKGKKMIPANKVMTIEGMDDLVRTVGEYQNKNSSIGYTFKYYVDTLYKSDKIKVIKINGIESSVENIRSRSYPFTTNYFGVIRTEDKDKVGGKFLDWVLSDEGQRCVAQAGYCAMR